MTDSELRDVYELHIREHMLGPGFAKEIIMCSPDGADEVLNKNPLSLYTTGFLYPQGADPNNTDNGDTDDNFDEDNDGNDDQGLEDNNDEGDEDNYGSDNGHNEVLDDQPFWSVDHFGLITCVPEDTTQINVSVSFAKYTKVDGQNRSNIRIIIGDLFDSLGQLLNTYDQDDRIREELNNNNIRCEFSDLIGCDPNQRTIWLNLNDNVRWDGQVERIDTRIFPHPIGDLHRLNYYLRMLFGDFYQRSEYSFSRIIDVDNPTVDSQRQPLTDFADANGDIEVYRTCMCRNGKKYIKILARNTHMYTNGVAKWALTLFQPQIKVSPIDAQLISYVEPIQIETDAENNTVEYIYRNVENYGKGVQCAVEWDDNTSIRTSFMPKSDVKKFSSKLDNERDGEYCNRIGINANDINDCCKLYNLSHWQGGNDNRDDYFNRLTIFVDGYNNWCNLQQETNDNSPEAIGILEKQQELLGRLRDNIEYLRNNNEAFECFKWANTAMLIQMTIARNETFKKNRDNVEAIPNTLRWFRDNHNDCRYFPFQLAFLLMNVRSTFETDDPYRNNKVDLIWFPTGGGKTEAYLALSALTIIARRRSSDRDNVTRGVSVLMRYTLRLLTSQQFERASYLICALEFLRNTVNNQIHLGGIAISIGLWIGNSGLDNFQANEKWGRFNRTNAQDRVAMNNPYPVTYCPWCGQRLVTNDRFGYDDTGNVFCVNQDCLFSGGIPVHFVSETVESNMPTMLFATVDKLAGLHREAAKNMFGFGDENRRSLDLIIQDELHLISGPLGSMVGFFESVVERMSSYNGRSPKIIASTATTRNTERLIANLYNRREVRVFPAQGLTYDDNYFSHIEPSSLRRHIGICMQQKPVDSEVRLVAQMLIARLKVIRDELRDANVDLSNQDTVYNALLNNGQLNSKLDNFWTQVLYYNSLKDLGRMHSRIGQEVVTALRYFLRYVQIPRSLKFMITGVNNRVKEFTSREDSSRIKDLLTQAESAATIDRVNNMVCGNTIDLVLASNMISVGIDINRWNVMLMSGQPRSTSEYIQSSSRVARSNPGLVINEYSPMRIREKSMFENFTSFHASYYKYVEPLSATPITMQTLRHNVFNNIVKCYKRYFTNNRQSDAVRKGVLLNDLRNRYNMPADLEDIARNLIDEKWDDNNLDYSKSLRDIDKDCYTSIDGINYPRR